MDKKIKHPFITSDTYFEELKENILAQTPGHVLDQYGKKEIYTVPENFFEQQYHEILNKKKSQEHSLFPSFTTKKTLVWVSTALTTVLLILFSYSYFGTEEINDILSKEGKIIQSDVTDMPDELNKKPQTDTLSAKRSPEK